MGWILKSVEIDQAVKELLQGDRQDATGEFLQSFKQLYTDEDSSTAGDEKLASVTGKMLWHKATDEKISNKHKDYKRKDENFHVQSDGRKQNQGRGVNYWYPNWRRARYQKLKPIPDLSKRVTWIQW